MSQSFLVPWNLLNQDEFVFASNTTIITENLITNAMNRKPKLFYIGKHENEFEDPMDNIKSKMDEYILFTMKMQEK